LTRGYSIITQYKQLIDRNKILENTIISNTDYIIFHEGNIPPEHQTYILKQTPGLDLQFINVEADFKQINTDIDPRTRDIIWNNSIVNYINLLQVNHMAKDLHIQKD